MCKFLKEKHFWFKCWSPESVSFRLKPLVAELYGIIQHYIAIFQMRYSYKRDIFWFLNPILISRFISILSPNLNVATPNLTNHRNWYFFVSRDTFYIAWRHRTWFLSRWSRVITDLTLLYWITYTVYVISYKL